MTTTQDNTTTSKPATEPKKAAPKKKATKPKVDRAQLELLATTINDQYGGHLNTFLDELARIQKGLRISENKGGGFTVKLVGLTGTSRLGGNAGQWQALQNWANAARRALNAD